MTTVKDEVETPLPEQEIPAMEDTAKEPKPKMIEKISDLENVSSLAEVLDCITVLKDALDIKVKYPKFSKEVHGKVPSVEGTYEVSMFHGQEAEFLKNKIMVLASLIK